MKPVARAGDTGATASSATSYPNDTSPTATGGTWTVVGTVSETTVSVAASDGKKIVCSARCKFSYTGTNTQTGATFTLPSPVTVTLTPATRKLKTGGSYPLVDGDKQTDIYGNELSVSSAATWRTA